MKAALPREWGVCGDPPLPFVFDGRCRAARVFGSAVVPTPGRDGSPSGPIFAAQPPLSRQSVLEKINDFRWLLSRILNVNFR
jgi:hypothetical protein